MVLYFTESWRPTDSDVCIVNGCLYLQHFHGLPPRHDTSDGSKPVLKLTAIALLQNILQTYLNDKIIPPSTSHPQNLTVAIYSTNSPLLWKPQLLYRKISKESARGLSFIMNLVHILRDYLLNTSSILSFHLHPYFPNRLFSVGFQANTFMWKYLVIFRVYELTCH
jgi:hypothetical protein